MRHQNTSSVPFGQLHKSQEQILFKFCKRICLSCLSSVHLASLVSVPTCSVLSGHSIFIAPRPLSSRCDQSTRASLSPSCRWAAEWRRRWSRPRWDRETGAAASPRPDLNADWMRIEFRPNADQCSCKVWTTLCGSVRILQSSVLSIGDCKIRTRQCARTAVERPLYLHASRHVSATAVLGWCCHASLRFRWS